MIARARRVGVAALVVATVATGLQVLPSSPQPASAAPVYQEDFSPAPIGWGTFGGSWAVTGGEYVLTGSGADHPKAMIDLTSITPAAFTFSADVRVVDGGEASLMFNANFPSVGANAQTGYAVGLDTSSDTVWVDRFDDRAVSTRLSTTDAQLAVGTTYRITIDYANGAVDVSVHGLHLLTLFDSMFALPSLIGLRGGANNSVAFDNLSIDQHPAVNTSSTTPSATPTATYTYKIRSAVAGKLLEVADDGTTVQIYQDLEAAEQQWTFESDGAGYWVIRSLDPTRCLTNSGTPGGSAALGAYLSLAACGATSATPSTQRWAIDSVAGGHSKLTSMASGYVATLDGGAVTQNTRVLQWDGSTLGPHQQWRLELVKSSGSRALAASSADFAITPTHDSPSTFGVGVLESASGSQPFAQRRPIGVEIVTDEGNVESYDAAYSAVAANGIGGWTAIGSVTSRNGTSVECEDAYAAQDSTGAFRLSRRCELMQVGVGDTGFSTRFGLAASQSREDRSFTNFEYFGPSTWYQQNGYNPATGETDFTEAGSIADDFSDNYFWVRETRMALPVFAMRNNTTGATVSLTHVGADAVTTSPTDELDPAGKSTDAFGRTSHVAVSDEITIGSLGIHKAPVPTLDFVYPASEGEATYVQTTGAANTWSRRAQPVSLGGEHEYTLVIKVAETDGFAEALKTNFRYAYDLYDPAIDRVDTDAIYGNAVDTLDAHMQTFGPSSVTGMPFKANVYSGYFDVDGSDNVHDLHMESGFVGQVIPASALLLRDAFANSDGTLQAKATASLDWWAANSGVNDSAPATTTTYGLVRTDYDMLAPGWFPTPIFVRVATDGMLGVLDAHRTAASNGVSKPAWLAYATRFGDWLVNNQNNDGSFYRAYNSNGTPATYNKFSTATTIRYLAELFAATSDTRYRDAAIEAGEFVRDELFPFGAFVGGTADYVDQVIYDKEAGTVALQGYIALRDITGDDDWVDAARTAADYVDTWIFSYPFQVSAYDPGSPSAEDPLETNPFNPDPDHNYLSDVIGLSLVKTGLSYTDVFSLYLAEPYYRLYLFTGDSHYLQQAQLFQHNANRIADWEGRNGLAQRGLVREGIGMDYLEAAMNPYWLPWVSVAQLEPLAKLEDRFGFMEIDSIETLPLATRETLNGN